MLGNFNLPRPRNRYNLLTASTIDVELYHDTFGGVEAHWIHVRR